MAARKSPSAAKASARRAPLRRRVGRWVRFGVLAALALPFAAIVLFAFVDPPANLYMRAERARLGAIKQTWVPLDRIAPVMARSVVAAEDANYCLHWGFDMAAIRAALEEGSGRGASTISQQVVKNVFLWQGRSWVRKALEAGLTPVVELVWSKRRIVEVYLNVAEFGEGVFGVGAAAAVIWRIEPDRITADQAARLAVVLPSPKTRNPAALSQTLGRRAARVRVGAETIRADGRAACFEG